MDNWQITPMKSYHMLNALSIHALMEAHADSGGSWAHFKEYISRTDDNEFNLGSAAHSAILEPEEFKRQYIVKVLKKDNPVLYEQQQRMLELDNVKTITEIQYKKCVGMRDAVNAHPRASELLNGHHELSGTVKHPEFGFLMKIRPDCINHDKKIIVDLKTEGRKIGPHMRQKIFHNLKWHWQADYYRLVTKIITGYDYEFYHIFVETDAPHGVRVAKLSESAFDLAAQQYYPLLLEYKNCLETDSWPGPVSKVEEIFLPGYAFGDGLE